MTSIQNGMISSGVQQSRRSCRPAVLLSPQKGLYIVPLHHTMLSADVYTSEIGQNTEKESPNLYCVPLFDFLDLPEVCGGRVRGGELTPGKTSELGRRLITSEAKPHAPCIQEKA